MCPIDAFADANLRPPTRARANPYFLPPCLHQELYDPLIYGVSISPPPPPPPPLHPLHVCPFASHPIPPLTERRWAVKSEQWPLPAARPTGNAAPASTAPTHSLRATKHERFGCCSSCCCCFQSSSACCTCCAQPVPVAPASRASDATGLGGLAYRDYQRS